MEAVSATSTNSTEGDANVDAEFDCIAARLRCAGYRVYPRVIRGDYVTADEVSAVVDAFATDRDAKYAVLWITDVELPCISSSIGTWHNVILLRTSLRKSLRLPHERLLPYVWEGYSDASPPCPRRLKPTVAFCGLAAQHPVRQRAVDLLLASTVVDCRFVLRTAFWGGAPQDQALRRDFHDNMRSCEFNLCVRGQGNYSMRFYQTLAFGRIPIVVDTDLVWPLARRGVAWSDYCVVCERADDVAQAVLRFWQTRDTCAVQQACRDLYWRYIAVGHQGGGEESILMDVEAAVE